jgi:Ca2+-binding EF-hand superfamily protein
MVEANAQTYEVPFTYRKKFSTEQITEMLNAFKSYDANANGNIDVSEFKNALHGMGHGDVPDEKV